MERPEFAAIWSRWQPGPGYFSRPAVGRHFGQSIAHRKFTGPSVARAGRNERSLYKLVCDEADKIVGIHLLGSDAPEILQMAAVAVKAGLTKADFDATVAIHPTMAEELVLMR